MSFSLYISSIYLSLPPLDTGWLPLNVGSFITGQFRCIREVISDTVLDEIKPNPGLFRSHVEGHGLGVFGPESLAP